MFFKKKPWYAFDPPHQDRRSQIAWFKTVKELRDPDEEIPRVLPGQNSYVCLNGDCGEEAYEEFCSLCEIDHACMGASLKINPNKEY